MSRWKLGCWRHEIVFGRQVEVCNSILVFDIAGNECLSISVSRVFIALRRPAYLQDLTPAIPSVLSRCPVLCFEVNLYVIDLAISNWVIQVGKGGREVGIIRPRFC